MFQQLASFFCFCLCLIGIAVAAGCEGAVTRSEIGQAFTERDAAMEAIARKVFELDKTCTRKEEIK